MSVTNLDFDQNSGWIGGFMIGTDSITDKADSMGMSSLLSSADDVRFWAGDTYTNRATAPFNVTRAGILRATGAIISGDITATTGTIGGFSVGSDYLRDAANSFGLASTVTGGDDVRFWAGATFANRATAPLRITEAGAITATSGVVGGFTIGATQLYSGSGNDYVLLETVTGSTAVQLGAGGASTVKTVLGKNLLNLEYNSQTIAYFGYDYVAPSSADGYLELYDSGSLTITLKGAGGNGTFTGTVRADTAFNLNGTNGVSATFDPTTITSMTFSGGILTAYS